MAHEIYYTSAPEGARPGQRGFCTVATSPGIPKPLWDRLEAVSGYRHQFSGSAGSPQNPIAWGHWLVQFQGREVSVLSRVCDSGLDYTQRTNAFAHHIALEPSERAAGGPAWMLSRGGLLATSWDGHVGNIARPAHIPAGDVQPGACSNWRRIAGDAGWAGVLADAAMKHPRRPVCILFSPGQDLLPLIAEAIALLPAAKRWDVSFNTYFTGLPGNTVCAWRCCLAGTPAAADAARHAAGSLVLDLAHPERLGSVPSGPWVEAARTGRRPAGTGAATSAALMTRIRSIGLQPMQPAPASDAAESTEDSIELTSPLPYAPATSGRATRFARGGGSARSAASSSAPVAVEYASSTREVDTSWVALNRRTRFRWMLALSALALMLVSAGIWLHLSAQRASNQIGVRPPPQPATPPEPQGPAEPAVGTVPNVDPATPVTPPPVAPPPVAPPTTQGVILPATTTAPAVVAVEPPPEPFPPQPPAVPVVPPEAPVPPPPPAPIILAAELDPPTAAGAGIRDPVQVIAIPATQFENLRAVATFQITLPPDRSRSYAIRLGTLNGTLRFEPSARAGLREAITWRDVTSPSTPIEVATVALELPRPGQAANPRLEVTWRSGTLLRRPDVATIARVALQNAEMIVADARNLRPQPITFKPSAPIPLAVSPGWSALALPPIPAGVVLREEKQLSDGWQAAWLTGPAAAPAPSGKPAGGAGNAADGPDIGVLRFERPVEGSGPASRFELRFTAGWKRVISTYAEQHQAARAASSKASVELSRAEQDVTRAKEAERSVLEPLERDLAEAKAQRNLSEEELRSRFTTKAQLRQRIERNEAALAAARKRIETTNQEAVMRVDQATANRQLMNAAMEAFQHLQDVDIVVEMPDKLRVCIFRMNLAPK